MSWHTSLAQNECSACTRKTLGIESILITRIEFRQIQGWHTDGPSKHAAPFIFVLTCMINAFGSRSCIEAHPAYQPSIILPCLIIINAWRALLLSEYNELKQAAMEHVGVVLQLFWAWHAAWYKSSWCMSCNRHTSQQQCMTAMQLHSPYRTAPLEPCPLLQSCQWWSLPPSLARYCHPVKPHPLYQG